jgi:hypothetical protein
MNPFASLKRTAAWLRILTCKPPDPDDRPLARVNHHQRHLEQDLELVRDHRRSAVRERLGAVSSLNDETAAQLGVPEKLLETLDLPRGHERRKLTKSSAHAVQELNVFVRYSLDISLRTPRFRGPCLFVAHSVSI